jgi:hypothetical protein
MKRAASPASLLDRSTPWLHWWQELILNWVATHAAGGAHQVTAPYLVTAHSAWHAAWLCRQLHPGDRPVVIRPVPERR